LRPPERLEARHDLAGFDCGNDGLSDWLRDRAYAAQRGEFSRTYVIHPGDDRVLGYYTLAAGCVTPEDAPARVKAGGSKHQIPVVILARLGVDLSIQGHGYGKGLVRDALLRIAGAADIIGVRAVLVHMKTPDLRSFYEQFDFEQSPVYDSQMFLLMKDLRASLRSIPSESDASG
jgi:GNAT superfamily N-acetyltransferase